MLHERQRRLQRAQPRPAAELRHRRDTAAPRQANADAALQMRWPFMRDAGTWGTPDDRADRPDHRRPEHGSSYNGTTRIPNEDSLDLEFTDANLFSLNRFPGIDRLEGGPRANGGAAWRLDLPGRRRDRRDGRPVLPHPSGQRRSRPGPAWRTSVSDIVSRVSFTPSPWFDLTGAERFDHNNLRHPLRRRHRHRPATGLSAVNAGYIYTAYDPYLLYDTPPPPARTLPTASQRDHGRGQHQVRPWRMSGFVRGEIQRDKLVGSARAAPTRTSASSSTRISIGAIPPSTMTWRHHDPVPDHPQDGRAVRLPRILTAGANVGRKSR